MKKEQKSKKVIELDSAVDSILNKCIFRYNIKTKKIECKYDSPKWFELTERVLNTFWYNAVLLDGFYITKKEILASINNLEIAPDYDPSAQI